MKIAAHLLGVGDDCGSYEKIAGLDYVPLDY